MTHAHVARRATDTGAPLLNLLRPELGQLYQPRPSRESIFWLNPPCSRGCSSPCKLAGSRPRSCLGRAESGRRGPFGPKWSALALVALLLPCMPLAAQDSSVTAGLRVRVPCGAEAPQPCRAIVGRLVSPASDSLLLEDEHGITHRIDLTGGATLERSVGYRRHTLLGLGIGTLVGVGTGAALVSNCTQPGRGEDNHLCYLSYFATIPVGAGLGALTGALTRTERWEAVTAPQSTLQILPGAGDVRVAVSARF